jgi:hypothetical protein
VQLLEKLHIFLDYVIVNNLKSGIELDIDEGYVDTQINLFTTEIHNRFKIQYSYLFADNKLKTEYHNFIVKYPFESISDIPKDDLNSFQDLIRLNENVVLSIERIKNLIRCFRCYSFEQYLAEKDINFNQSTPSVIKEYYEQGELVLRLHWRGFFLLTNDDKWDGISGYNEKYIKASAERKIYIKSSFIRICHRCGYKQPRSIKYCKLCGKIVDIR